VEVADLYTVFRSRVDECETPRVLLVVDPNTADGVGGEAEAEPLTYVGRQFKRLRAVDAGRVAPRETIPLRRRRGLDQDRYASQATPLDPKENAVAGAVLLGLRVVERLAERSVELVRRSEVRLRPLAARVERELTEVHRPGRAGGCRRRPRGGRSGGARTRAGGRVASAGR